MTEKVFKTISQYTSKQFYGNDILKAIQKGSVSTLWHYDVDRLYLYGYDPGVSILLKNQRSSQNLLPEGYEYTTGLLMYVYNKKYVLITFDGVVTDTERYNVLVINRIGNIEKKIINIKPERILEIIDQYVN